MHTVHYIFRFIISYYVDALINSLALGRCISNFKSVISERRKDEAWSENVKKTPQEEGL